MTTEKCIFVGYGRKGYMLYNLKTKKVILSRDVLFNEAAMWSWESNVEVQATIPFVCDPKGGLL